MIGTFMRHSIALEALSDQAGDGRWMEPTASPFGQVSALAPVEQMPDTPARFDLPPAPLGTHAPAWL